MRVKHENMQKEYRFEVMRDYIENIHDEMHGLFHNLKIYVDYTIELRDQIRKLDVEPLPYPEELLEEFIPD